MEDQPKKSKRRKTMGDAPTASVTSSFHTQTLTQFLSNKDENENEDIWQINDSNDDEELGVVMETPKKRKYDEESKLVGAEEQADSAVPSLIKSVTPSNRQKKTEIPSSHSPITPMLMRYSPAAHNSPLKSKSTNAAALSPAIKKLQKTPKDRVIPDSYSTVHTSPTTPTQKSTIKATPTKRIRFDLPDDKENITPGRTKPKSPKPVTKPSGRKPLREVPDSDEDLEETGDEEDDTEVDDQELPDTPSRRPKDHISLVDDTEPPETCYDEFGEETQAELLYLHQQPSDELGAVTPEDTAVSEPEQGENEHVGDDEETDIPGPSTPSVIEQTPVASPRKEASDKNTIGENVAVTQDHMYTQNLESQRLPLEVIHALGPQTPRSDIMVSLHPEHVTKIVDRTKDHEFRAWKIPPEVSRVWVYITKPVSELKYLCIFGPPKVPGEIQDERGIGNAEFNQGGKIMKFAYEILQVYELNNPVSLVEMKNKGWVSAAPQKYAFIPPAVVGELTANLRCALFGEAAEDTVLVSSSPNLTESQELKAQLQSDTDYSTQHPSPGNVDDEVVLSSQTPRKLTAKQDNAEHSNPFVKPAIPKTQSGSSIPELPALPSQKFHNFVRPSQATTVSQSSSSPALSPGKSVPRPINISSQSRHSELHSSSPTAGRHRHHSLRSSQFLTRSQMLPDSLLNEEIEEPPPIIWGSADEQSD
ncbi:hypothetical protein F5X99DRAFT_416390 [Biscogniauxia marginata]|nr:hypothetical protein F5X99DRAFT_416390 [Biscogniauxia marginata]